MIAPLVEELHAEIDQLREQLAIMERDRDRWRSLARSTGAALARSSDKVVVELAAFEMPEDCER